MPRIGGAASAARTRVGERCRPPVRVVLARAAAQWATLTVSDLCVA
jgi:hypothetical protein